MGTILRFLLISILIALFGCQSKKLSITGDHAQIRIKNSKLIIQVCSPSIFHVQVLPEASVKQLKSLVVDRTWDPVKWTAKELNDSIIISTTRVEAHISIKSGAIRFVDSLHRTIITSCEIDSLSLFKTIVQDELTNRVSQKFHISPEEGLYGLGQYQDGIMNYRGKEVLLAQANRTVAVPFLISTKNYGIIWDNYSESLFRSEKDEMSFTSETGDGIDYYLVNGTNPDEVISGYREATGTAPLFGKWAYGYWQSKEHYKTKNEVLTVAKDFRKRKIPIDNIVQDWAYWGYDNQYFSGMTWDTTRYPDPHQMIDSLHQQYHLHFMCSIWPAIGTGTALYDELNSRGYMFSKAHWSTGRLYDAYNSTARDIYWKYLNKGLFSIGVDAFWMDGSEPEITSSADPYITSSEIKALGKNTLGTFSHYLNPYSLVHTKGVYEHQRQADSSKRVFILTRSAFTGQQKYAAVTWSGDIGSNWRILRNQITAGINFCMSGIPYWTSDIGGFLLSSQGGMYPGGGTDPAYQELYVRWYEFGAFCPIFRSHGTSYPREPWQFGDRGYWAYDAIIKYDQLRYRLLPYIYSCAWKITNKGYTLMRGLPMDFPNDPNSLNIDNEFMFGPAFLVCPVSQEMYHKTLKQEDFIPGSNLMNDKGETGSLKLEFYKGKTKTTKLAETPMVEIALSWSGQIPDNVKKTDYTAEWNGEILSIQKGKYTFVINSNSDVKLWINDKLLISSEDTLQNRKTGEIILDSGVRYRIRLENYQFRPGAGNLKLEWIKPQSRREKNTTGINCYLPPAKAWFDFWTGEKVAGSRMQYRKTPIDIMPLYVRSGSIIPIGPYLQYSTEKEADTIELRVYTGMNAQFDLYEDEGDSYNYEKGKYALIPISWEEEKGVLKIEKRIGGFAGMMRNRVFRIVWVGVGHGVGLGTTMKVDGVIKYSGEEIQIVKDKK